MRIWQLQRYEYCIWRNYYNILFFEETMQYVPADKFRSFSNITTTLTTFSNVISLSKMSQIYKLVLFTFCFSLSLYLTVPSPPSSHTPLSFSLKKQFYFPSGACQILIVIYSQWSTGLFPQDHTSKWFEPNLNKNRRMYDCINIWARWYSPISFLHNMPAVHISRNSINVGPLLER